MQQTGTLKKRRKRNLAKVCKYLELKYIQEFDRLHMTVELFYTGRWFRNSAV